MAPETERVHHTWIHSDRKIPKGFMRPIMRFTRLEAASGSVLLIAAVIALIWANAPFGGTYKEFWESHLHVIVGSFDLNLTLQEFVNDALMAIFFFVVGLEIKRELVVGELKDKKKAALPAIAALGGMIVPAVIYTVFVVGQGGEASGGWAIPMATDIAFSVGVISLLGKRVTTGAKLFLLTLAIADDIGAIIVIAVFYSEDLSLLWLGLGLLGLLFVYLAQRAGIRSMFFYWPVGIVIWFFILQSGVHATLAGVALGLMTPVYPLYSEDEYQRKTSWILGRFATNQAAPNHRERLDYDAMQMAAVATESVSPLDRLEEFLAPWSGFFVVPIFALANAGVRFADFENGVGAALTSPVTLGVALGLLVGKLVGISSATWIAVRTGIGRLPSHTGWSQVIGLALLAGIGFTVSMFVTELAFTDAALTDSAKVGIFIGSGLAGIIGTVFLRRFGVKQPALIDDDEPEPVEAMA
jgi:NhaA family Na+:H+ antiporter